MLGKFPGKSLLCLTVQLPGPEKRNALSLKIARAAVAAVRETFSPDYEKLLDLETGFEGFFLLGIPAQELKRRAVTLEDTHPLGRLFDLDVIASSMSSAPPQIVGRDAVGEPPRRCLLCDRPARFCMRARCHTQAELLSEIEKMVKAYGI